MTFETRFKKAKLKLLNDPEIVKDNKDLFKRFFDWEEEKLKRQNGLPKLDEPSYSTLYGYINRFRNVNHWFRNKPWNTLTEKQIKQVYNDLEDGKLKTSAGKRFEDRSSYYTKVFKSKPFQLAGLHEKAVNALEFFTYGRKKEVRFVNEENFRKMVAFLQKPQHFVLFWLAWDISENISSLLELQIKHFKRQINRETREPEYIIYLPKNTLKRARRTRSEPTIYPETVRYLDALFKFGRETVYQDKRGRIYRKAVPYKEDDFVFTFKYRQALQIFASVIHRSGATCEPNGEIPSWKDLRSGMACHLHSQGWHVEDINMRLGHSPQSKWFESYVNYLAVNRKRTVKAHFDSNLQEIKNELEESKQREKLYAQRLDSVKDEFEELKLQMKDLKEGKGFIKLLKSLADQEKKKAADLAGAAGKGFDVVVPNSRVQRQ